MSTTRTVASRLRSALARSRAPGYTLAATGTRQAARAAPMDDLLIRGGLVLDGSGADAVAADVAVRAGRIVAIAPGLGTPARRVIDARGSIVAPGFIDIKTHSDFTLPRAPRAESKVLQGVTTEVVGHCGFSLAPVSPGRGPLLQEYLSGFGPWIEVRETDMAGYLDRFPATAVNTIMQVGHNTLRLMTVGMDDRAPTDDEMAEMRRLLSEGLAAGALGLSSGLFTAPGSYARSPELLDLLQTVRRHRGTYATHVRDEANDVLAAVREAIAAGERSGVHVQIVHMKLSGVDNWGRAGRLLEEIDAARRRGVAVDADVYPYTSAANPLRNLLPSWVQEGGIPAMLRRLGEPALRARLAREIDERGLTSFGRIPSWEAVGIGTSRTRTRDAGRSVAELARASGAREIDVICDLLVADGGATYVMVSSIDEADVRSLLRSPAVLVGSDGRAVAPDSVAGQGRPHPRFYGTFPRVLGHYARELGLLSLPEAIAKMTGRPAQVLGLRERGLLREGYAADVTVFDPARVIDRATYEAPQRYPLGISTVIVNGTLVVEASQHTGALPGRVLRRGPAGVA
ncbi:MAG TPA: D-aminoacylase [Methylomirabilota bacterium]|nr:D-aminoacylase [Methylomirabilota bacterium]